MKAFYKPAEFKLPVSTNSSDQTFSFLKQKMGFVPHFLSSLEPKVSGLCVVTEDQNEKIDLADLELSFSITSDCQNIDKVSNIPVLKSVEQTYRSEKICSYRFKVSGEHCNSITKILTEASIYHSKSKSNSFLIHCEKIEGPEINYSWSSELFNEKHLIAERYLKNWYAEFFYRKSLFKNFERKISSYRILHKEYDSLTIDKYDKVLWFSSFSKSGLSEKAKMFFNYFSEELNCTNYLFREMINRGNDPETKKRYQSESLAESWNITENQYQLVLRSSQGQSSGIFMDQRANREWVKNNSSGKKVLNLFSYTCGFSLASAFGGANAVYSVDTSKASLEWGKDNFKANSIDPNKHFFYSMETDRFLDISLKKENIFDLIICDPPSFARNKKSIFKIEKELAPMLEKMEKVLSPKGRLLLSLNYESWSQKDFEKIVQDAFRGVQTKVHKIFSDGDYERDQNNSILKWILIEKV